ncbi:MAG: UTP--glucose-1-phosphate uridylyltransferase [Planctomycetota bacterium]
MGADDELLAALRAAGQDHVAGRLAVLSPPARAALRADLAAIDLPLLAEIRALIDAAAAGPGGGSFAPPEVFPLRRTAAQAEEARRAAAEGERLLAAGRVGFVTVAGGQASRLGFDAPKGIFPVGPVTGRPLFAVHARRLCRVAARYGVRTPWYVMTSPANDAATREIFAAHDWFGIPPADVFLFPQGMLPALGEDGRLLFAAPDRLFRAPDGHGGVLRGLRRAGALDDMRARGLEELSYFQVDNPLVRPADPLFLGLHHHAGAEMSSKAVAKRDPGEKVGVLGRRNGRLSCIEYSDLPAPLREARDPDGRLRFGAGNIAMHVLRVDFLGAITAGDLFLPWHVARKKMRVVDERGRAAEVTGCKFESFVFDALERARASVVLEVDRALEFSPVKSAAGEDSPATVRRDLCALYAGWAEAAGLPLPPPDAAGNHPVEVDPLLAETREEFLASPGRRLRVCEGGHLYE